MADKLPKGWIRLTMGDVGRWVGGGTPSKANLRFWTDGNIPWVSPKDMKFDLITDAQDHITEDAVAQSATNLVPAGSVLVVVRSGILQHTLPVAVAQRQVALNQDLKAVKPLENIRSDYLAYALRAFEQKILHTCTKTGTTVQSLELPVFLRFPFPVAPIPEQERIAAKLDTLLSRLGAGEVAARRALNRLQRYRAAVLHAAVTGELTRDWRKTHKPQETGEQLLNRMLKVRRSRWELRWLTGKLTLYIDGLKKSKLPRSRFLVLEDSLRRLCSFRNEVQNSSSWDGDWKPQWSKFQSIKLEFSETAKKRAPKTTGGITRFRRDFTYLQSEDWKSKFYSEAEKPELTELPEIPHAWAWASVDQLAAHEPRSITDGPFGSHLKSSHYTKSGPRVIRLQNIGDGVFINEMAHISQKHYEFLREHSIHAGDLVIRALGIPAPRACRIPDIGPAIVKADCIRFKVAEEFIDPSFVLFALNAPTTQHRTEKKIHGVGRPRLNLGEIKSIALPMPPQKEQKQIAREIERRLTAADRLASTLCRKIGGAQVTRQSLLREAFAGKLVPQESDDEPAAVLLERIRAAREAETKKPKAKRMPKTKSKLVRRPLLDVLREHKKAISPEELFREAGFQPSEADVFYRELSLLRQKLRETKPIGTQARAWPQRAKVLLALKKH